MTLAQAQAGHLPMIAKAIDKDSKGYVTLSDIQAWRRARAEQRYATQDETPD